MGEIDTILRYSAFGLLLWLAVLCFRDYRHLITGRLGGLSALSIAAYLHASKAGSMIAGADVGFILHPLASLGPVFLWLFCLSQFDDHFEITWWHKLIGAAKAATGIGAFLTWQSGGGILNAPLYIITLLIGIGIMAHLGIVVWNGRREDLVEERCRFRMLVSGAVIVVTVGILLGEPLAVLFGLEHYLMPVQAGAVLAVTMFLHWQISSDCGGELFVFAPAHGPMVETSDRPEDMLDLRHLDKLIADKVYLEPGLTISRLADMAGVPEHRLRRLINQHLGFRNFSDYLNHHRIGAAKERLACVDERHLPVLTIAMDLGYQSLGPFNRAFKERTGQTPTEFRRQALADC